MIAAALGLVVLALAGASPEPDDGHKTTVRPGPSQPPPTAVIGADALQRAPDVSAALDGEVGLRVVRLGGLGAYATLSIRGSTPEQVLVVLDGIPLAPADGAPVDLATLPVGPLDAVALYRGRAPWVFGRDAIGGVVALRSRSPRHAAADATLGAGSFDTRLVRGWAATPLGDAAHVAVALEYGGSASDFRFVNDQGTAWTEADDVEVRRRNAGFDQGSVLVKGLVDLGDAATLTLLDLVTVSARGLPGLGVFPTRRSRFAYLRNLAGARLDARIGRARLGVLGYVGWSDTTLTDPLGEIGLGAGRSTTTSLVPGATLDVGLPLALGAAWRLVPTLVLAWRHEDAGGTDVVAAARELVATSAEVALRHRAGVELTAGLRLELLPALEPSLRLEAATTALADLRLSLAATTAHRLPSLFELHGDTGTTLGQPALRPERAQALELAARWDVAPGAGLELFAFASAHDDLIQIVQNAQGVVRPENVASARILGLELAAEAELFDGHLRLRGGLALLDAIDTSDIAARAGKRLPLRPPLGATARVEGRWGGDGEPELGVWLELDHTGSNALDFANLVQVPARRLLGAGLWVATDAVRVDVTLANLLDDRVADLAGYPLPGTTGLVLVRVAP